MPSVALQQWNTDGAAALDQLVAAHRSVGGTGPGRRYATREINHAYAVMLSSRFQRFCRDLHSEAVQHLASSASPSALGHILHARLLEGRKLDRGNANPSNLGSDFGRLGFGFWTEIKAHDKRNGRRQERLEELNRWRNAIAHQDFGTSLHPPPPLQFRHVQTWRSACEALALSMDVVVGERVGRVVGNSRPGDRLEAMSAVQAPSVGSLAWMSFGGRKVAVFLAEDRGRLGVGGRHIFRVQFRPESTEDAIEMEVPIEELEVFAHPGDPAESRTGVEAVGTRWVGTYTDLTGRIAIVTDEMSSPDKARQAAIRWAKAAENESKPGARRTPHYTWRPDPNYPGRYSVFQESRLGPKLSRESA